MNNKWLGAIIGGVAAGVLTLIPIVNFCCLIWVMGGGFFAFWMYSKDSAVQLPMAEAAKVGAVTGGIAAAIVVIVQIPLMLFGVSLLALPGRGGAGAAVGSAVGTLVQIVGMLFGAVLIVGFAVAGAVIAQALLKPKTGGGMTTPPPPSAPTI